MLGLKDKIKADCMPQPIRSLVIPGFHEPNMQYVCLKCGNEFDCMKLHYTCPDCGGVFLLIDRNFCNLKKISPLSWRSIFDHRRMLNSPALKGIFRYHELIAPVIPLNSVVYLGEGNTPLIAARPELAHKFGVRFYFKNDGQNPSASFKDRGMACAFSCLNYMVEAGTVKEVLAICASTGDTSASAALYASYLPSNVKSAVLLPQGKVTPQQLGQPLGSGARVFEIPGVFDDCMKIVESLSNEYDVALVNSKNAWRILGQESYAYEIAQDMDWIMSNIVIMVPIGNAGNITAIMSGFLKLYELGIIEELPKIVGVQSEHANPAYKYFQEKCPKKRKFEPMAVKPSVAQAAMIGNPVSMPRVIYLAEKYDAIYGGQRVFVVEVTEQDIMDCNIMANREGHIACTHGGECLAGLSRALRAGIVNIWETAVLDSTAHALKFAGFQDMYNANTFPSEYGIVPDKNLQNFPQLVRPSSIERFPEPGLPLAGEDMKKFVAETAKDIAERLALKKK